LIAGVIVGVAALAALAWAIAPTRRPRDLSAHVDERRSRLIAEKRHGLAAIVELEEDLAAGKLNDADFDALRRSYEEKVLHSLHGLENASRTADPDDPIEAEVAAARARLSCPGCGALRPTGEACPRCGSLG
jgi:hypothetical protein